MDPSQIATRSSAGITADDFEAVRRRGGTIRQLAHAAYDRATSALTAWVAPVVVARDSIFARTTGAQNAALITGAHAGEIGIFGAGAGGDATAVAVISDIAAIARDRAAIVPAAGADLRISDFSDSDFRLQTSDVRRKSHSCELAEAV